MNERPTPETNAMRGEWAEGRFWPDQGGPLVQVEYAERLERERDEARELAGEMREAVKAAREQLAESREGNAKLREAVKEARDCILQLLDNGHDDGCDWINYAKAPCTCGVDDGHIVLSKLQPFLTP